MPDDLLFSPYEEDKTVRGAILALSIFALLGSPVLAADDTPAAAATRKMLKEKVTVNWKNESLENITNELKDDVKGLVILLDSKQGVSRNRKFTYKAKNKPVEEVLNDMLKDSGLGYYVVSEKGAAYDGAVMIVVGNQRGNKDDK